MVFAPEGRPVVVHLTFALYLVALVAGTAAISQAALVWQRYRKPAIAWYARFLLSLWLILAYFIADAYARVAGVVGSPTTRAILWLAQALGGLTFVVVAPHFFHSLIGVATPRWGLAACLAVDSVAGVAALVELAHPGLPAVVAILISALFGTGAYGLVFVLVKLHTVADKVLRRALGVFVGLTLVFFPLMLIDSVMAYAPFLAPFHFLEGLAQPSYFLVLNALSVVFGLKYLNRPSYAEGDRLTDHCKSAFGITEREAEIVGHLLRGATARDIAEALFISPKTVENHLYNIYQKLGVRNRVQLYQLIHANASEPASGSPT